MKITLYAAVSLDGFIARPDGSIDWLDRVGDPEDAGDYAAFYDSVDVLVMGGKTWRQLPELGPYAYGDKPVWVYSRHPLAPERASARRFDGSPDELAERLRNEGLRHAWLFGGGGVNALFLRAGLVDEMRVFVVPVALGAGIPLFAPPVPEVPWDLAYARPGVHGLVELHYVAAGRRSVVRPCSSRELEALRRLSETAFRETFASCNTAENLQAYCDYQFTAERLAREFATPGASFHFVCADGRPGGYVKLNLGSAQTESDQPDSLEVERIYVLKEFHGQGLGRRLMDFAFETARAKGLSRVWLGVWEHNRKAIRFYEKAGFKAFGSHPFRVGGDVQTDILMRKDVD